MIEGRLRRDRGRVCRRNWAVSGNRLGLIDKRNHAGRAVKAKRLVHRFRVVCVDVAWIGSGDVFFRGAASDACTTLAIARVNQNHFVPLRRLHGHDARWRRPEP